MKFNAFNLKKDTLEVLEKLGYTDATPVQDVVIPKALKYDNIVVQSETGSGKTHSFLIPIMNNVLPMGKMQVIIVSPTRELARQTYNFAKQFNGVFDNILIKLFVSGEEQSKDLKSFENEADIIIATPGKLNYLLNSSSLDLANVKTIVLDEADMLVEDSFLNDIDIIISKINNPQIEVFSATISKKVEYFLKKYIGADYILDVSNETNTSKTVKHYFINTKHKNLFECVKEFIDVKRPYLLLVFTNSKEDTRKLYEFLSKNSIRSGILSGELEARERKSMLRRINNNEFNVVVCSDIASRGLDIKDVSDVLSIDLPNNIEYYYHRAGRTGRQFKNGNSYVFYDNDHTKMPLKLISDGIQPSYLKFRDGELVEDSPIVKPKFKGKKHMTELDKEIREIKYKTKTEKVKPNYKKKVKLAIDKVKRKHKRKVIEQDIRRQRVERYKKEAREHGE